MAYIPLPSCYINSMLLCIQTFCLMNRAKPKSNTSHPQKFMKIKHINFKKGEEIIKTTSTHAQKSYKNQ